MLLYQVEGRAPAKGQDIWKVRGCWVGLEGGVWALCDRMCLVSGCDSCTQSGT